MKVKYIISKFITSGGIKISIAKVIDNMPSGEIVIDYEAYNVIRGVKQ